MEENKHISSVLCGRAMRLNVAKIGKLIDFRPFHLAGGALGREKPNDFDVYPADGRPFDKDVIQKQVAFIPGAKIVTRTRNAVTVDVCGQIVQFCSYVKPSLRELVESFDYAHCQVGVTFTDVSDNGSGFWEVTGEHWTDNWMRCKLTESTFYTGSEYPLASVIRTVKYANRRMFSGKSWVTSLVDALTDVVKRGFRDYQDFKDQLDAIDLGLSDYKGCWELFHACEGKGLVDKRFGSGHDGTAAQS